MNRFLIFLVPSFATLTVPLVAADQTVGPIAVNGASPAGLQITTAVVDGPNASTLIRAGGTTGLSSGNDTEQRVVVYGSGDNTAGRTALVLQHFTGGAVREGFLALNGVNVSKVPTANGGLNGALQLGVAGATPLQFSTSNTARMTVDPSGNVGIGALPSARLSVNSGTNDGIRVTDGTVTSVLYSTSGAVGSVGTVSNNPFTFWSYNAERMRLDASGNLGIGTTSPIAKLHVNGNILTNGAIAGYAPTGGDTQISTTVSGRGTITMGLNGSSGVNAVGAPQDTAYIGTGHGFPLVFTTLGAERMRIDTSGNLGVGVVPVSTSRLQLKQSGDVANPALRISRQTNDSLYQLGYRSRSGTWEASASFLTDGSYAGMSWWTSDAQRLTLDAAGRFGIGVVPAAGKGALQLGHGTGRESNGIAFGADISLWRASPSVLVVDNLDTQNDPTISIRRVSGASLEMFASASAGFVNVPTASPLVFRTSNLDRVLIDANGNVGIGTTTPTAKLAVNGTVRAKEVRVEATPWPDYVFEPGYVLRPLEEVADFVKKHRHLPDVPTAHQVASEGLAVADMATRQMTKIEELTLYAIKADSERRGLADQVAAQAAQIARLEALTQKLMERLDASGDRASSTTP